MTNITLYHMPGSCSNVTLNALEEIGEPYADRGVALLRGDQRQPAFLAVNPKGKVPVLVVGDRAITETPVILLYLSRHFPEGRLLPVSDDAIAGLEPLSDLIWCSDKLHHFVRAIFRPVTIAPDAVASVKATAIAGLRDTAATLETRFASQHWWYGDAWSMVDVYLSWVMATAAAAGFPLDDYPALSEHRIRVEARPSFGRAAKRGANAIERDGLGAVAA